MFDKHEFAKIIKNIKETYSSQEEFSKKSGIGRTYLSQYMNMKLEEPPKPKILEKLANASKGFTSYEYLMRVCGYFGNIRGDRLKSCRLSRNLSLDEVANKIGVSTKKLSLWENGHDYNMDIESSLKLADLYNVDFNWLLGSSDEQYFPDTNDFRFASYNGIDTKDLDEEDIKEINRFVEFIRNKKKSEKNK